MEITVAQKLDNLLKLQQIDSALDNIRKIRGDLPEEVQDLEDEIAGYETRHQKFKKEVEALEAEVGKQKLAKKDAEKLIARYKEQQMNVRNNREFDAISKEMELQQLEIELADKRSKDFDFKVLNKKDEISSIETTLLNRKKDLEMKKKELNVIIGESEEDEVKLNKDRDKAAKPIEERLFKSYEKIRSGASNGLAIVLVRRGACGGCFNMVPPQRQADIRDKKKIIVCEHCGRILADVEDAITAAKR
jgi:uncharacterized protein